MAMCWESKNKGITHDVSRPQALADGIRMTQGRVSEKLNKVN